MVFGHCSLVMNSFVCTVRVQSVYCELIRSYESRQIGQQNYNCALWEAARATTAAPIFFEPIILNASGATFVGGGIRANKPVNQIIHEAQRIWPERRFGCIIGIGTGWTSLQPLNLKLKLHEVLKTLTGITTDAHNTEMEFIGTELGKDLQTNKKCFRFSVEEHIGDISTAAFEKQPWMEATTAAFLEGQAEKIAACTRNMVNPTSLA